MDQGRRLRLSGGCLLVLSLTALILCTRPHGAVGQTARIDELPQSQTAPLGANVTFECSGNGDIIWLLNPGSIRLDQEDVRTALAPRDIYTEFPSQSGSNRLFVLASAENNQTVEIHCIAEITAFDNAQSDPAAILTVFGPPLAPTGLNVEVEAGQIELTWTAPFTLPGENVTYTIEITNPGTSVPSGTATETEFQFVEPPGSVICSPYTFRVFTENAAGMSESSSNAEFTTFPTGPGTVNGTTTSFSLEGGPSVTLTFQTPIQCVDYPPSNYTVTLMAEGSNDLLAPFPASGAVMESFTLTSVQGLMEDTRYSAMVTAANPFGSTTSTGEYVFFTTDLQQFIVSLTSTTLDVTCTLAAGSSALGCNVIAVSAGDPTPFWSTNLTRSGDELELTMSFLLSELNAPSASFSVFAMDLEEDGSVGDLQFSAEAPTTPPPSTTVFTPTPVPTPPLSSTPTPTPPATPNPGPTESSGLSQEVIIIVAAAAGGTLLLVVMGVICIIVCVNCRRAKSKYGLPSSDHPRTSSHLYSTTPPHQTNQTDQTPATEPSKLNMVEFDANVPAMYAAVGQQDTAAEEPKPPAVYDVIPNGRGREFEHPAATPKEGAVPNPVYETVGNSARQSSDSTIKKMAENPMYSSDTTIKRMAENPMYSQPSELHKPTPYQVVTFNRQKQRDPNQIDLMENMSYGALPAPPNGNSSTAPR